MKKKEVIGLIVPIVIKGKKALKVKAKVDTGAEKSSICKSLLMQLGKVKKIGKVKVKNPIASEKRDIVELEVKFKNKIIKSKFTVADRKHMSYNILLGKNTLKQLNVLIDPNK